MEETLNILRQYAKEYREEKSHKVKVYISSEEARKAQEEAAMKITKYT